LIEQMEADNAPNVVVSESADPEFFIAHYDMSRAAETPVTPGPNGLPPWVDFTTRMAACSVITSEWKNAGLTGSHCERLARCGIWKGRTMEWTIKLEARSGWGEVETIEVGRLKRRVVGLTADEVGLTLAEGKDLLSELQRLVLQTQMEEYTMCARVCQECLTMRRQRDCRTRTIQTLFGTVKVDAPRISICPCSNEMGFVDLSFSPLVQLFPDRCTPELRRVHAELGARHSFREASQLLSTLLPCSPTNHATIRNRTHRIAAEIEAKTPEAPKDVPASTDEMVVMIDGAHIRAAPGYQSRHLDVTVGKVEVTGRQPRRFALAPKGSDHPLAPIRAALVEQGGHPGQPLAVISDGEAALPNLMRAAAGSLCATRRRRLRDQPRWTWPDRVPTGMVSAPR
jgi:hypothetical protein